MILIAAVFDFLDGFVARLLKAHSPLGKSLDSLADLVSFGVLPGLLLLKLQSGIAANVNWENSYYYIIILSPLLIPLASAIRLARFDNDPTQTDSFRGLPTPANAIFIAALIWISTENDLFIFNNHILLAINLALAYLLISPLKFISLKFKTYSFKENFDRYLIILLFLGSIIIWKLMGVFIGMALYILFSIITGAFNYLRK